MALQVPWQGEHAASKLLCRQMRNTNDRHPRRPDSGWHQQSAGAGSRGPIATQGFCVMHTREARRRARCCWSTGRGQWARCAVSGAQHACMTPGPPSGCWCRMPRERLLVVIRTPAAGQGTCRWPGRVLTRHPARMYAAGRHKGSRQSQRPVRKHVREGCLPWSKVLPNQNAHQPSCRPNLAPRGSVPATPRRPSCRGAAGVSLHALAG
jgi:hypothetical protein